MSTRPKTTPKYYDETIANGATTTSARLVASETLVGIIFPSTLTGTAVSFLASVDGTNYHAVYDATGTAVSVAVVASAYRALDPITFLGCMYIKVVSNATESGGDTIRLVMREFE